MSATRYAADRRGATMIDYGLLAGLIAVGAIVAVESTGRSVSDLFSRVSNSVEAVYAEGAQDGPIQTVGPGLEGASCAQILAANPGAVDGVYHLDPDGDGVHFDAYCDMTQYGGGWTLVVGISRGNAGHTTMSAWNATALTVPDATGKFSDVVINQLLDGDMRFTCGEDTHFISGMSSFGAQRQVVDGEYAVAVEWQGATAPVNTHSGRFGVDTSSALGHSLVYSTDWSSARPSNHGCFNREGYNTTGEDNYDGAVYVR